MNLRSKKGIRNWQARRDGRTRGGLHGGVKDKKN